LEKLQSSQSQVATGHDVLRLPDQTAILGDKRNGKNKIAQLQSASSPSQSIAQR
jgi:hypothetical protein